LALGLPVADLVAAPATWTDFVSTVFTGGGLEGMVAAAKKKKKKGLECSCR